MLLQLASLFTIIMGVLSAPAMETPQLTAATLPANPPQLTAQSAFLIDTATGSIFFNQRADQLRPIASITKLMSALVILDNIKDSPAYAGLSFDSQIIFQARDKRNGGIPYLIPGEEITMRDAWNLMLVGSSNDAAALLARISTGSEESFVRAMNKKARDLGLKRTIFTDPTGLHSGNISTARETAAFSRAAFAASRIREATQTREFSFTPQGKETRAVYSTNWLLGSFSYPGARVFGGKTGHIEESGYNLVSMAGNKKHELVGVVLGSENNEARFNEIKKLFAWGFKLVDI